MKSHYVLYFACFVFCVGSLPYVPTYAQGDAPYLVIDLGEKSSYAYRESSIAPEITSATCRTTQLWLRRLPGTSDYMGIFEVTQAQYERVTGENPARHKGPTRPVECVSWQDAREKFLMCLTQRIRAFTFDLPSESLWKKACLADSTNDQFCIPCVVRSHQEHALDAIARYGNNRRDGKGGGFIEHVFVGSYSPNGWGLYDMHGNVAEMCLDLFQADALTQCLKVKGGCWYPTFEVADAWSCGAQSLQTSSCLRADKHYRSDLVGFRVYARTQSK